MLGAILTGQFVTAQDLLSHECGTGGIACQRKHRVEISDTSRRFLLLTPVANALLSTIYVLSCPPHEDEHPEDICITCVQNRMLALPTLASDITYSSQASRVLLPLSAAIRGSLNARTQAEYYRLSRDIKEHGFLVCGYLELRTLKDCDGVIPSDIHCPKLCEIHYCLLQLLICDGFSAQAAKGFNGVAVTEQQLKATA
ncbi:hypothetical protein ACRRTK_024226 [Alexandromys fortis]